VDVVLTPATDDGTVEAVSPIYTQSLITRVISRL
jgi:hypothetical protein